MPHDVQGVEAWRVDLVPLIAGNSELLATYSCIDISLDPFPYAGWYPYSCIEQLR